MGALALTGPFDKGELRLYFSTILQLLWPGYMAQAPDTYGNVRPTDLQGWSAEQLKLMLEVGRQQLAQLNGDFEVLRARGQWLFTTTLALLVLAASQLSDVANREFLFFISWYLGVILMVVALLGSAAVFLATAQLGSVDSVMLSRENPNDDLLATLARSYAKSVVISANTYRARFTILRDSLWFLVVGVLVEIATWSVLMLSA